MEHQYPSGYTESDRFHQCLEYHRYLLSDYIRRWQGAEAELTSDSISWPRKVPTADEIASLELDLCFCLKSPAYENHLRSCQDKQFRIASFYLSEQTNKQHQLKGYKMVKELAEHGHPDGMCFYGIILNNGRFAGVDANPEQAVIWWRRSVDYHKHISATYELALALYTGEGVAENPALAVSFFGRAAHLGHAGAAYMLGECLLDGVGAERDRASALEWLVTAAELGHHLARDRVIVILQQDYDQLDEGLEHNDELEETKKWVNGENEEKVRDVNIERRFTIGGGSSNPQVLARRKTKVEESRDKRESVIDD
ncbi:predicted protein [Phaeodactylum tricornutum CCAP 1055/1]|uniref:Uncharacterized protein n=2 Tax=Phaeodactylum tricornutum TaxID=2850 RepID=B7FSS7_PHATC|nr:predicted protein [Phaeodactylum tricornutum CCAP 1055/1]EEC50531.1 predicted protein [Phaeodactylum tricornutum CCAP 1055/1]|eukprot:XP_002177717.1 predicted protein [Phaeodactylum tricornutum CCAP 1055/1]